MRPLVLRLHLRDAGADPVEDALEVGVDHLVPDLVAHVDDVGGGEDSGVGAEDVDGAVTLDAGRRHPLHVGAHRDVGLEERRLAAGGDDLRGRGFAGPGAAVHHQHARAFLREHRRDALADAAAGAGHDRGLPLQRDRHGLLPPVAGRRYSTERRVARNARGGQSVARNARGGQLRARPARRRVPRPAHDSPRSWP